MKVSPRGALDIIGNDRIEAAPAVLRHTMLRSGTIIIVVRPFIFECFGCPLRERRGL